MKAAQRASLTALSCLSTALKGPVCQIILRPSQLLQGVVAGPRGTPELIGYGSSAPHHDGSIKHM